MAQKSLFKNLTGLFAKKENKGSNISASQAISLQQEYQSSFCDAEQKCNAPYLSFAEQLYSERPEIASAAVFYLKRIALNQPQYRADITNLLREYARKGKLGKAEKAALLKEIEALEAVA
ncbi:MAG: hypothetical protein J6Y91_06035 [Alphaproteobacteria bacterium]|nr:hypothetical protein [Alphaproteobacteria bacterium]